MCEIFFKKFCNQIQVYLSSRSRQEAIDKAQVEHYQ